MIISNYVLLEKGGKHRLIHASKCEPAPADLANKGFYVIIWVGGGGGSIFAYGLKTCESNTSSNNNRQIVYYTTYFRCSLCIFMHELIC